MKKILTLLIVLLTLPSSSYANEIVRCESKGDAYRLCRINLQRGDEVRLEQRFSKASCSRGRSWGLDRRGIWVDRGCRADFLVSRERVYNDRYEYRGRDRNYVGRDEIRNDYGNYRHSPKRRLYNGTYKSESRGDYYDYRNNEERRRERRRLREERRQLEAERQELRRQKRQFNKRGSCPKGAVIGRCSDSQRARGCKDWKAADGTPCKSGG